MQEDNDRFCEENDDDSTRISVLHCEVDVDGSHGSEQTTSAASWDVGFYAMF